MKTLILASILVTATWLACTPTTEKTTGPTAEPTAKEAPAKATEPEALSLLEKRRDCIIDVWKKVHEIHPARFEAELRNTLLGPVLDPGNWELPAFSAVMEAIELTACQRGIERWGEKYVNAL